MKLLRNNSTFFKSLKSNQGFTLIEILVALFLITIVLGGVISGTFNSDGDLDKQSNDIERAVRFMGDEAVLRNSVVRFHFMLGKAPQEYAIEYGPSSSFVLPPEPEFESSSLTKEEEAKALKAEKSVNMKFNKVKEFQDSNTEVSDNVKIIGIGTSQSSKLKSTGEASIYTFPTGEKDEAIIILGNDTSLIALEIDAFSPKVEKTRYKLEASGNRELSVLQDEKAKEIFETWSRKK